MIRFFSVMSAKWKSTCEFFLCLIQFMYYSLSDFVLYNHSYDYRPNGTPLSPVTITNQNLDHNQALVRFTVSYSND